MNKLLLVILLLAGPFVVSAQWSNTANNFTTGTLALGKSSAGTYSFEIIKNAQPYGFIYRDALTNDSYSYISSTTSYHIFGSNRNGTGALRNIGFAIGGSDSESDIKMVINGSGNVGVGTLAPGVYRMNLAGDINNIPMRLFRSGSAAGSEVELLRFCAPGSSGTNSFDIGAISGKTNGSNSSGSFYTFKVINPNQTSWDDALTLYAGGSVGVGSTTTNGFKMFINGTTGISAGIPLTFTSLGSGTYNKTAIYHDATGMLIDLAKTTDVITGTPIDFKIDARGGGKNFFTIKGATGNILINKSSQQNTSYKLDIGGKMRADEIVVNTNGADFVFDENYKLPKIEDVAAYIRENKHLPEISSATEMQQNGVEVGKLETQLLQKIEELTLYLINQNEKLQQQNDRIMELEKKLEDQTMEK